MFVYLYIQSIIELIDSIEKEKWEDECDIPTYTKYMMNIYIYI